MAAGKRMISDACYPPFTPQSARITYPATVLTCEECEEYSDPGSRKENGYARTASRKKERYSASTVILFLLEQ